MPGIGMITNPHSKLNKRNPGRPAVLSYILGEQGQMAATESIEDLGRVAKEFKNRGISVLALNGGDGTISRTLTAFIQEYGDTPLPKIAVLGGGTINVLARNLGMRGSPEQVLYRLVEAHSHGEEVPVRTIPSIRVEGQVGFLFGNGVAGRFLEEYYKHKSGPVGGAWWAFRVWLSRFFGSKLYDSVVKNETASLTIDGAPPIRHQTLAIFCCTIRKMPLGFPLFRQLGSEPDNMQCVSFTFAARRAVVEFPWTMLTWKFGGTKRVWSQLGHRFDVEMNEPFLYTLDGELFESKSNNVSVELGPRFEFLLV